jgi:hypothetical protein
MIRLLKFLRCVRNPAFVLGFLCALASTADAAPPLLFFGADGIRAILEIDPGLANSALNSSRTFVAGGDKNLPAQGWKVRARQQYRSLADFQADRGPINEPVIVYNPEPWAETPENEQRDPISASRTFANLAHAKGKAVLIIPSCNLLRLANGPGGPTRACVDQLLVPIARVADYVDFEAQSLETNPQAYSDVVHYAVARMKAANPNVKVIVQLSTADRRRTNASTDTLLQCARSVADVVDGYFIFVGRGADGPSRADPLVRALLQ